MCFPECPFAGNDFCFSSRSSYDWRLDKFHYLVWIKTPPENGYETGCQDDRYNPKRILNFHCSTTTFPTIQLPLASLVTRCPCLLQRPQTSSMSFLISSISFSVVPLTKLNSVRLT